MSNIKVLALHAIPGDYLLKAFVDIEIGSWTICDFRVVQQGGQRAWVSCPQSSWKGDDGQVHYKSLIKIPKELKSQIDAVILAAWEKPRA